MKTATMTPEALLVGGPLLVGATASDKEFFQGYIREVPLFCLFTCTAPRGTGTTDDT